MGRLDTLRHTEQQVEDAARRGVKKALAGFQTAEKRFAAACI